VVKIEVMVLAVDVVVEMGVVVGVSSSSFVGGGWRHRL